jgi:hypothetical protein
LASVPELTRSADIKLNSGVKLLWRGGWLGCGMPRSQPNPKSPEAADLHRLYEEVCRLRAEVEKLEAKLNRPSPSQN